MKIIIDGSMYSSAPSGGVYRYFNELIPRLSRFPEAEIKIFAQKDPSGIPKGENIKIANDVLPTGTWLPEGKIKQFLRARKQEIKSFLVKKQFSGLIDSVYHATYYTPSPWKSLPEVVTVHDMISELFEETFHLPHVKTLREAKAQSLKSATRVIAISEQTKKDLQDIYNIPPSQIDVIYHGVDHKFFSEKPCSDFKNEVLSKHKLSTPYFLYVGGRLHHKNFKRFLVAFSQSKVSKDYRLAVAGAPWNEDERELIKKLAISDRIIRTEHLNEKALSVAYQNAEALALPSYYEGFGLPLIEAMAAGCPVIASNTGPFPELAEGSALFFDPKDESQMSKALESILEPKTREALVSRGLEQARKFSWDTSAKKHMETYQKALSS